MHLLLLISQIDDHSGVIARTGKHIVAALCDAHSVICHGDAVRRAFDFIIAEPDLNGIAAPFRIQISLAQLRALPFGRGHFAIRLCFHIGKRFRLRCFRICRCVFRRIGGLLCLCSLLIK